MITIDLEFHFSGKHAKLKETIKTEIPVTDLVFKDEFVVISCGSHDG